MISGKVPHRMGNGHANLVPYQAFRVADGEVIVASKKGELTAHEDATTRILFASIKAGAAAKSIAGRVFHPAHLIKAVKLQRGRRANKRVYDDAQLDEVFAAGYGIFWLVGYFSVITLPLAIALLITALVSPVVNAMTRAGLPRGASSRPAVSMRTATSISRCPRRCDAARPSSAIRSTTTHRPTASSAGSAAGA